MVSVGRGLYPVLVHTGREKTVLPESRHTSPVKGPEGNIEYLVHIRKNEERSKEAADLTGHDAQERLGELESSKNGISFGKEWESCIDKTVAKAHESLDKPQENAE